MRHPEPFRRHAAVLRRQFLQDGGLPFADVLTDQLLSQAMTHVGRWLDRVFPPLVTLWVFLGQVLGADHSCRAAVARLNAHRAAREQRPCSARTGAYPQVYNQGPGVGFPIARLGAVFSLACGAVVNLGFSRYAGKGQGEVSLLRRLWDVLRPGDVLLGDRLMSGWVGMHLLKGRGVDTVSRLSAHRRADFRKGTRLGKDDHLVVRPKPNSIRSVDRPTYNTLPDAITVREARFRVDRPGFRTKSVVVVTTLLDPRQATREELAELYRARWHAEVDQAGYRSSGRLYLGGDA